MENIIRVNRVDLAPQAMNMTHLGDKKDGSAMIVGTPTIIAE
jgi:hypothetical protein